MAGKGKRFMTALLAVAVLGGAGIAAAGDQQRDGGWSGHEHGPGPDAMFGAGFFGADAIARMGDQLELSAEQRQSIKGVFDAARPQMQAMRESMLYKLTERVRSCCRRGRTVTHGVYTAAWKDTVPRPPGERTRPG